MARKEFLAENHLCRPCFDAHKITHATQVHHMAKRRGEKLLDRRDWLPVCAPCHRWIEANKAEARQLGYLKDF